MSQSFQSPSRPVYHKEGQKSTQEPVAAANLRMIPTSRPNPATAVIASNKLRRIPPSRSNPTQNIKKFNNLEQGTPQFILEFSLSVHTEMVASFEGPAPPEEEEEEEEEEEKR
ncbi:hypothetical protein JHK87_043213 [Glycine soja]|nr:hypothetical protein JHK87_043213 [Glycine soja]